MIDCVDGISGLDVSNNRKSLPKFMVVGHRGHGMNVLVSPDKRMNAFKENSILSFNNAANHPLDFIEFDVQVFTLISSLSFQKTKNDWKFERCLINPEWLNLKWITRSDYVFHF